MVVRPKISISLKGWYGTKIEILGNLLRKVRAYFEPVLNLYFSGANPNFWDKYNVFPKHHVCQTMSNACWTRAKPVLYPCKPFTYLFGFRGVPPLPLLLQYWNILIWNRHRHRNYWWVMLAIHAIQWLRGSWGAPRVSQPRVCWRLRPRMLEYAGIGWFYSFLSSPSKLQTWKHRVLWKNLVFFHILRFCRVLSFKVHIYIYTSLYISHSTVPTYPQHWNIV